MTTKVNTADAFHTLGDGRTELKLCNTANGHLYLTRALSFAGGKAHNDSIVIIKPPGFDEQIDKGKVPKPFEKMLRALSRAHKQDMAGFKQVLKQEILTLNKKSLQPRWLSAINKPAWLVSSLAVIGYTALYVMGMDAPETTQTTRDIFNALENTLWITVPTAVALTTVNATVHQQVTKFMEGGQSRTHQFMMELKQGIRRKALTAMAVGLCAAGIMQKKSLDFIDLITTPVQQKTSQNTR